MRSLSITLLLFAAACRSTTPTASGTVEVKVTEKGFEPDRIRVAGGKPITLRFTRTTTQTCADAVDIQGDPVRHMLPLNASVDVKVTPPPSGQLAFACPMKMYGGAVVVVGQ